MVAALVGAAVVGLQTLHLIVILVLLDMKVLPVVVEDIRDLNIVMMVVMVQEMIALLPLRLMEMQQIHLIVHGDAMELQETKAQTVEAVAVEQVLRELKTLTLVEQDYHR